ncbi:MAG: hypothetical protein ACXU8S_05770 [Phenylobacterium sp.]
MQLSAVPVPVVYTPIQPVPQVGAVKGRDPSAETADTGQQARGKPPSGIGLIIDLLA